MSKKLLPSQVRLGMYIEAFEGGWLSHPFWRTQFHVTDPDDLERVHLSKVKAVVIDESKSLDIGAPDAIPPVPAAVATDRVPDAVAHGVRPLRATAAAADDKRPLFTRYIASEPDAAPSTRSEHANVTRVLATASRALTKAFEGVARGDPISADGFDGIIDGISLAMANSRSTMIGLSRLKLKDNYTFQHSVAVGALMLGLARDLELDEALVRDLALAGLLHDVGKMQVADAILNKPGALSDDEFAEMKRHPALGHEILKRDGSLSPIVLEVALRHHERLDGRGYPDGLAGDAVSLYARIAAICDVFDALTSARAYKDAISAHDAITMMAGWEGHFDRDLLVAFMRTIGAYPLGMLVRLSSQRLGVVLPPVRRAGRPRVRAFHCATQDVPVPQCDVVIADCGQSERVIAEERPEDWSIGDWPSLRERLLGGSAQRAA